MKTISKRSMFCMDEGIACGPISICSIEAEITVEDNGETIYLKGEWVDVDSESIFIEATKKSVYDIILRIEEGKEDFDKLIDEKDLAERDNLDVRKYRSYFKTLKKMIIEQMDENDVDYEDIKFEYDY